MDERQARKAQEFSDMYGATRTREPDPTPRRDRHPGLALLRVDYAEAERRVLAALARKREALK